MKKSYKVDKPDVEFIANPKERDLTSVMNFGSSSESGSQSEDEAQKEAKFGLKDDDHELDDFKVENECEGPPLKR